MSRRKKVTPTKGIYIMIPEDLATEVRLVLTNPITGKPHYGSFSRLVTSLLSDWLRDIKKQYSETGAVSDEHTGRVIGPDTKGSE